MLIRNSYIKYITEARYLKIALCSLWMFKCLKIYICMNMFVHVYKHMIVLVCMCTYVYMYMYERM